MQELSYGRGSIELLRGPWRLTSPIVRFPYSDTSKVDRSRTAAATFGEMDAADTGWVTILVSNKYLQSTCYDTSKCRRRKNEPRFGDPHPTPR